MEIKILQGEKTYPWPGCFLGMSKISGRSGGLIGIFFTESNC